MQKKIMSHMIPMVVLSSLLSFHELTYTVAAYIPEALKRSMVHVYEISEKTKDTHNLQEVCHLISENRMLTSDDLMRNAVNEAITVLESKTALRNRNQDKAISSYLKEYLNHLNDRTILLNVQGNENCVMSWPASLVARSLKSAIDVDMMYLSNELATLRNISLCGNVNIDFDTYFLKSIKENEKKDPSIAFTPNMMTNAGSNFPNVVFAATGVSSPVINAWSMAPSSSVQSPINMQFAIPGNLRTEKAMSVELHFLIKNQPALDGNARIRVNAKYMQQDGEFNIFDSSPTFTHTTDSDDFLITEPSSTSSVEHVYVIIPIEKSDIENYDFALLSVSRIAPTEGVEYSQDIYLAAAAFRYTKK